MSGPSTIVHHMELHEHIRKLKAELVDERKSRKLEHMDIIRGHMDALLLFDEARLAFDVENAKSLAWEAEVRQLKAENERLKAVLEELGFGKE